MIDALNCDYLELAIRDAGKDGIVKVNNFQEYYDKEGHHSAINTDNNATGMFAQYVSKAGLKMKGIVKDYNIWCAEVEKRTRSYHDKKTSIVMSSYGHPEECEMAIDGIVKNTTVPFELIVVNNMYHDRDINNKTVEMLKEKYADGKINCLVILQDNLGDMGAINQGILRASGHDICVVNNDIIPSKYWLQAMLDCARQEQTAGLVSGRTNSITGSQIVHDCPSNEMVRSNPNMVKLFSDPWCAQHELGWWKVTRIRSFVMLMTRTFLDNCEGLDMRYGMGNYDDDDVCMQALTSGMGVFVVDDCYVHHWGSLSFGENMDEFKSTLKVNLDKFKEKWMAHEHMMKTVLDNDIPIKAIKQDLVSWRLH